MSSIDLSSLSKAIVSLEAAITRSKIDKDDDIVRDAVIQRFEYTYELAFKLLKRTLEKISITPGEVDAFSFNQLLRNSAERGLIDNVQNWIIHRYHRNLTSHTYNQEKAEHVYAGVFIFFDDVKKLYKKLELYSND